MKKKNYSKKLVIILGIILLIILMPLSNFAHGGRTDSSGGHKDNKNASGLGAYHYHCGGNPPHLHTGGVCPYSGAASTPAPAASSASSKTTTSSTSTSTPSTTQSKPKTVSVSYVDIEENDFEIIIGENRTISATVYPSNATNKKITWESSNEDVIKIDSQGNITALGIGDAIITVKASNGEEDNIKVTVNPIEVSEIKLDKTEINLKVDETATVQATILPENATDPNVEWKVENEEIASIEDGVITAKGSGTTNITCSSKNGIKSEVLVTVEDEEIVKEETEEVVASVVENEIDLSNINNTNNVSLESEVEVEKTPTAPFTAFNGICTAIALGTLIGVPVYGFKSRNKENKLNIRSIFGNILSYGVMAFTLLIAMASSSPAGLVVSMAASLSIAPPICNFINAKFNGKYTVKIRVITYIVLFVLTMVLI